MRRNHFKRNKKSSAKGTFNPDDDTRAKHTRIGVWDLYEEKHTPLKYVPGSSKLAPYFEMAQSMPFVWRMIKDISTIKRCWFLLFLYLLTEIIASLLPAVSLWYSGQLLYLVQLAVEQRTVDKNLLLQVAAERIACVIIGRLLQYAKSQITIPLNMRIKQYYSVHIFRAMARLDLPTFEDSAVQRQLEASWSSSGRSSVAWETLQMASAVLSTIVRLVSQVSVLFRVLRDQQDGPLLGVLCLVQLLLHWFNMKNSGVHSGVWAATTKNADFIRMQGLKRAVDNPSHRKEMVAGNIFEYMTSEYQRLSRKVGDDAGDFREMHRAYLLRDRLLSMSLLREPLRELPQIVFALRAISYPASIPLSLASLNLINHTADSFGSSLISFFGNTVSFAEQLSNVRRLYEITHIANRIVDGTEPFPENQQSLRSGVSIEFRNVSFRYPDSDKYALRNVSFKIQPGQLCVIVGANGSGKSTILKLIARLYDPVAGAVFIDGRDVRTLQLAHLRRAISTLFQDYTHFPLSVKENIGLGDPEYSLDDDKVREAARLGGAHEFIDLLPNGFDTYLERPVADYYSGLPEGTTTLFGRPVNYSNLRGAGGMHTTNSVSLSGGQMQRLAVSRSFMRSLISESEPSVGLLLFDEPSASLDPTAEHDLFQRLNTLRGNKTMIFSSHRFGNLTRFADIILYMNDSIVAEEGTHAELVQRKGEYARIWDLQAQAFLP